MPYEPERDEPEFAVGDKLVFREWDEMAERHGTNPSETAINSRPVFLSGMKRLCGASFTVRKVTYHSQGEYYLYSSEENVERGLMIGAYMLRRAPEPVRPAEIKMTELLFG